MKQKYLISTYVSSSNPSPDNLMHRCFLVMDDEKPLNDDQLKQAVIPKVKPFVNGDFIDLTILGISRVHFDYNKATPKTDLPIVEEIEV